MLHSKMGLEMRMRDALDGMEQLASMYAYGRLTAEMEIVDETSPLPCQQPEPQRSAAQIIQFPTITTTHSSPLGETLEKHNKIIML